MATLLTERDPQSGTAPGGRALDPSIPHDCQVARSSGANLLLVGSAQRTDAVIRALWPTDQVSTWHPGETLTLPDAGRTVILRDIGQLTADDQRRLSRWLELELHHAQVVSTAPESLLSEIEDGAFADTLFYRLNTICVQMID